MGEGDPSRRERIEVNVKEGEEASGLGDRAFSGVFRGLGTTVQATKKRSCSIRTLEWGLP